MTADDLHIMSGRVEVDLGPEGAARKIFSRAVDIHHILSFFPLVVWDFCTSTVYFITLTI